MNIYHEIILDHYRNPRNTGCIDDPTATAELDNPMCGDHIAMDVRIEHDKIADIRFRGQGCAISQASASMLTEKAIGMAPGDVIKLTKDDILEMLGTELSPSRLKCALLPLETLRRLIDNG